jgi:hypothetical protein
MNNTISPEIRRLPIYLDGLTAGTDLGLVIALNAITAERIHQERIGTEPDAGSPACRMYADGALHSVAKVLARRFR